MSNQSPVTNVWVQSFAVTIIKWITLNTYVILEICTYRCGINSLKWNCWIKLPSALVILIVTSGHPLGFKVPVPVIWSPTNNLSKVCLSSVALSTECVVTFLHFCSSSRGEMVSQDNFKFGSFIMSGYKQL